MTVRGDFKELVDALKQIKINPDLLLLKCPALFDMDGVYVCVCMCVCAYVCVYVALRWCIS